MSSYEYTYTTQPVITTYSVEGVSRSSPILGNFVVNSSISGSTSSSSGSSGAAQQVVQDLLNLAAGGSADASGAVIGGSSTTYVVTGGSSISSSVSGSGLATGGVSGITSSASGSGLAYGGGGGGSTTTYVIGSGSSSGLSGAASGSGVVENSTIVLLTGGVSGGSVSRSGSSAVLEASAFSALEQAILQAKRPFDVSENETITINGQTGVWANKQEVLNWKGVIPITEYQINEDVQPEIVTKRTDQILTYEQEIAIRYLRPPTPPPPGEILIRQEKNIITPPAPPLVIRQQPPRPETPAPLVIREAPPRPPVAVGSKVITISGKRLPPPPRKVVVERLPALPSKPQSLIIERWLPYSQRKRRVIFQKPTEADPVIPRPRNVIVQWETPQVQVKKEFRDLGVIRANPVEYVQTYGTALKTHIELPDFVKDIRPPTGVVLAAEWNAPSLLELEGDVKALSLIDLDREGLSEYRSWLSKFLAGGSGSVTTTVTTVTSGSGGAAGFAGLPGAGGAGTLAGALGGAVGSAGAADVAVSFSGVSGGSSVTFVSSSSNISIVDLLNTLTVELFGNIDANRDARITLADAENFVIRFNNSLGRSYTKDDAEAFFKKYDINREGPKFKKLKKVLLNEFSIRA